MSHISKISKLIKYNKVSKLCIAIKNNNANFHIMYNNNNIHKSDMALGIIAIFITAPIVGLNSMDTFTAYTLGALTVATFNIPVDWTSLK